MTNKKIKEIKWNYKKKGQGTTKRQNYRHQ